MALSDLLLVTPEAVANALERSNRHRKVSFLWGAGCSITAGIDSTEKWIDALRSRYPPEYWRGVPREFMPMMKCMRPDHRRKFILEKVNGSGVNWAHLALVQLLRNDIVDRIMTVNFDSLIERAATILGYQDLAAYDIASSPIYIEERVSEPALFYLHGRGKGFVAKTTEDETRDQAVARKVFEGAKDHIWVVIGYSGKNDNMLPEFLAPCAGNPERLYWCYRARPTESLQAPPDDVVPASLPAGTRLVPIEDADRFMVDLCLRLGCFPPGAFLDTRNHLHALLEQVKPFHVPSGYDISDFARRKIASIAPGDRTDQLFEELLTANLDPERVSEIYANYGDLLVARPELRKIAAALAYRAATRFYAQAKELYDEANGWATDDFGNHSSWRSPCARALQYLHLIEDADLENLQEKPTLTAMLAALVPVPRPANTLDPTEPTSTLLPSAPPADVPESDLSAPSPLFDANPPGQPGAVRHTSL